MPLAATAAIATATALIFAYVAWRLGKRVVTDPAANAAFRLFRLWWLAAAIAGLAAPLRIALYLGGLLPPWAYLASEHLVVIVACAGLAALIGNLAYLHWGDRSKWIGIAIAYAVLAVALIGYLDWLGEPVSIRDNGWTLVPESARAAPLVVSVAALCLLVGPPMAGAIGYLLLLRHAPDATARYRIILLSVSLLLWFGSTLLTVALGLSGLAAFALGQGMGVASACAALAAYDPPGPIRQRGVQRAGEEERVMTPLEMAAEETPSSAA